MMEMVVVALEVNLLRLFPNQEVKSIEYGYVTVVDNAGNVSTPIVDDSINSSNICDVNIDLRNRCLARINVDVVGTYN